MDTKLFQQMFGNLQATPIDHASQEVIQSPKGAYLNPKYIAPDSATQLTSRYLDNNRSLAGGINAKPEGYEGMYSQFNSVFGEDSSKWLHENMNKLSPEQLKKLYSYINYINKASETKSQPIYSDQFSRMQQK